MPLLGTTLSHVNPTGFVFATAANGSWLFGSVLLTDIVCAIAPAPTKAITLMDDCPTLRRAVLLTFNVTGITSAGEVEPGTVRVILPLHTCGVVRPVTLTDTTAWFRAWVGGEKVLAPTGVETDRKPGQLDTLIVA